MHTTIVAACAVLRQCGMRRAPPVRHGAEAEARQSWDRGGTLDRNCRRQGRYKQSVSAPHTINLPLIRRYIVFNDVQRRDRLMHKFFFLTQVKESWI